MSRGNIFLKINPGGGGTATVTDPHSFHTDPEPAQTLNADPVSGLPTAQNFADMKYE